MHKVEYSFAVLCYTRDPSSGERLNFGVVVVAPDAAFAKVQWDPRASRLSECFADFSLELHRDVRREFLRAVARQNPHGQHRLFPDANSAEALVRSIWPDGGLSYHVGKTGLGVSDDLDATLEYLYERYVADQSAVHRPEVGTSDGEIWKRFTKRAPILNRVRLSHEPFRVEVPGAPLRFDYAAKNGKWHLFQPLSFQLMKPESMRDKAARWSGYGHMLAKHDEIAQIVFMLGAPVDVSRSGAFLEAREFLSSISMKHVIVDDRDPRLAADRLEKLLRDSKLLF